MEPGVILLAVSRVPRAGRREPNLRKSESLSQERLSIAVDPSWINASGHYEWQEVGRY